MYLLFQPISFTRPEEQGRITSMCYYYNNNKNEGWGGGGKKNMRACTASFVFFFIGTREWNMNLKKQTKTIS